MPDVFVWTGRLTGGALVYSGRIHNLVIGYSVPCHTILLLNRIKHVSLLYDNLQQASITILMDTKDVWARMGMECACVDDLGIHGRYKSPVCVYCSVLASRICMTRGWVSGLIFLSGDPGRIKFSVASASEMAWFLSIFYLICVEQSFLFWRFYALY